MIELPQVTVIIADTKNYGRAAYAITKTLEQIKPAKVVWLTDIDFQHPQVEVVKIEPIKSKAEYSKIIIKDLDQYFYTTHCLVIQHDGYVINGDAWKEEFLKYDYIGAPWLYPDPERNVGNGGFSIRSKPLQAALWADDNIEIVEPEDEILGRLYRRYLEKKYGIKFAPEELAHQFSYELHEPYCKTFGFHGYFHPPFREVVVINRTGAMGDVIQLEPIMHHYWMNGYRVVLKTLPQFYSLFASHYFPVESYETFNKAVPHRYIDLDMSYESLPKQLHMKSYFEMCGINDGRIRNAKLNYHADETIRIIKQKYVVIHIDRREQPHRNVEGIAWWKITEEFKKRGYLVVQIGKNDHIELDAIQMQTLAEPMLAYVIAGCDLFIGCDSGPSHIAVATGRKSILFFGSVNPKYIHANLAEVYVITNHWNDNEPCCPLKYCWHESIGTKGQDCIVDKEKPPCSNFNTNELIGAINTMLWQS